MERKVIQGETSLEEPMWNLGLGDGSKDDSDNGGDSGGDGANGYPERTDEADCIHYLRTGSCDYGAKCRFNHPLDRNSVNDAMRAIEGELPERFGEPICQYYMRTRMCKYGASCIYHHPKHEGGSASSVAINIFGYPLRPGEEECSYYLKSGQCKYGMTCKFHHPQPAGIHILAPGPLLATPVVPVLYPTIQSPGPLSQQYGVVVGNWPAAMPTVLLGSYIQGLYGEVIFSPGIVPMAGWNPYQAPMNSIASPSALSGLGAEHIYGMTQLSSSTPDYVGPYLSMTSPAGPSSSNQKDHSFPERPGQDKCQHYLKTGECKFGSSCKYDHPTQWSATNTNFILSPMGLPLRQGTPVCSQYAMDGVCKFGHSCKFDHPMSTLSYSPPTSSLSDIHVSPYPVGLSTTTLAPSSLSMKLKPEVTARSNKEDFTTKKLTSASSTASSVSSISSQNLPLLESGIQQSIQSSKSSADSSITPHVSDVRTSV